jgi:acyl dehydratase
MEKRLTMRQDMIDQYGRINGDNDIVHYDEAYAKARGFRGTLAHGLHVTAYAAEVAARTYGAAWFTGGRIATKWIAPVCPGDDVRVSLRADGAIDANVQSGPVMIGRAELRKR